MNEPASSATRTAPVSGGTAAFGLGAALLAGLVLMLGLALVDRQRRTHLEGWEERTAVGDRHYFVPASDATAPAVITWDAGILKVPAAEPVKMRDTGMRKAGSDQATGVSVYTPIEKPGGKSQSGFFVKVAPGKYLPALPAEK